jgi:predicted amidohydrolase YtcJ
MRSHCSWPERPSAPARPSPRRRSTNPIEGRRPRLHERRDLHGGRRAQLGEAIAIDDGRISYVGTDAGAKDYIGPNTKVVDLKGRMVLPGMQDVHIHPISGGMEANACDLNALNTAEQYVAKIKECADAHPDDPWITGGGWSMAAFGPGAIASKKLIDAVVADRPVSVYSRDGHSSWANSKAIEIAGITNDTPDPPDGRIDRDPKTARGHRQLPGGRRRARSSAKVPPPTEAQRDAGLRYAVKMLNGYGITESRTRASTRRTSSPTTALDKEGQLSLHVVGAIWWERGQGLEQIENIKRLRANTRAADDRRRNRQDHAGRRDGELHGRRARAVQAAGQEGRARHPDGGPGSAEEGGDAARRRRLPGPLPCHRRRRRPPGARTRSRRRTTPTATSVTRHHISHLQLIHRTTSRDSASSHVIANFQPLWAYADEYVTNLTLPFISKFTASYMYPIGSLEKSGAVVAFGSDWSVSTANPFEEMETAVTRMGALGDTKVPFLPDERIDLPEALAAFTINAAYHQPRREEHGLARGRQGREPRVLDRNLFEIPANDISDTKVLLTLFEGKPVHGDIGAL